MKNSKLVLYALLSSVGTVLYVSGVVWLMTNGERFLGKVKDFRGPLLMLLLFVFSAAFTASLVLGRPILLYLDGFKKEAIKLLLYTLAFLFLAILITFCTLSF